ncbi:MAG: DUF4105 domain-containing protein [Bacteroidia bacterium]|nr:DUF4105 domain-containing protein [Bacteroidia bacterium]
MRHFSLVLFSLLFCLPAFSQRLSSMAEISLLTVAPGSELYSAFGHSAIRVHDPATGVDEVYNYGTFDFNTPNFYPKFMQGKLEYMVDKDPMRNFDYAYRYFERTYQEQVLDISQSQKQGIADFLAKNNLPENRFYLYDFFFDNCATRLRDVVENVMGDSLRWGAPTKTGASFRDYLHEYLTEKAWIEFGIDLALGAVVDREADIREQMFLPDYLATAFGGAEVRTATGWKPLLKSQETIYEGPDLVAATPWYLHPLSITMLIMGLMLWHSWLRWRGKGKVAPDVALWVTLGIMGCVISLLWFATDHTATAQNWNLLWANPLHLLAGLGLVWRKKLLWLKWYFLGAGSLGVLLLLLGTFLPQHFPLAFYPIFVVIAVRGLMLFGKWDQ